MILISSSVIQKGTKRMAKDPAMLWYWADWNSGTTTLSRFLKGCYMDLLHAQFNSGHLSLDEIKTVLGSDFGTAWPTLQKKFKKDDDGLFFNVRLQEEKEKRIAFTTSRRNNLESKAHTDKHKGKHMAPHMDNVNVNKDEIVFGEKKETSIVIKKVFANDMVKRVYDLEKFFEANDQLESMKRAGMDKFDEFMQANPANIFKDDNHLYNSFRKFCVTDQLKKTTNGKTKKFTLDELNER
jgi:hypothetical protein